MASRCSCKQKCCGGSSRSLVRRIGSRLPIKTGKRLFIRVPDSPGMHTESEFRYEATGQRYVPDEEGLTLASYINNPRQLIAKASGLLDFNSTTEEEWVGGREESELMEEGEEEEEEVVMETGGKKQEAMDKISALESELAQLKAQIAVYAMSEVDIEGDSEVPVPPPPPPPVPPPLSTPMQQGLRESAAVTDGPIPPSVRTPAPQRQLSAEFQSTPAARPAMSEMLRDIGSVKLRTVNAARSPGGTPLRPTNKGGRPVDPNDPASIIAQALRKKFSHRVFRDSPDKENLDRSDASINLGFESPTVKLLKN